MSAGGVDSWSVLPGQLRTGMEVIGSDIVDVGRVKEVHADDFLVDRPLHRDIYVPHTAVRNVTNHRVVLAVPAVEVDRMGWRKP